MKPPVSQWTLRWATLAVLVECLVSGNLLTSLGSAYISAGGLLAEKLHPGTYLAAAAMMARLLEGWRPARTAWRIAARDAGLAVFLAGMSFCVLFALVMTGTGNLIVLLDTFLPAGMLGVALADMAPFQAAHLARTLRALFVLNAVLALGEAVAGAHLITVAAWGDDGATDFRPIALYDHPLTGAAATMVGLFLAPDPARRPAACAAYGTVMFAALLAFGGRTALLVTVAVLAGWHVCGYARQAALRRLTPVRVLAALATMVGTASVACIAVSAGLAARLQAHSYWDASAQARLDQLQILGWLTRDQLLFGARRTDLLALIEPVRLANGVDVLENFWLLMFISLGALCFPVFVIAILGLVRFLWRRAPAPGRMMVLALLVTASGSNSLGRKSTLLVVLVACVLASGRPAARGRHAAAAMLTGWMAIGARRA